MNEIQVHQSTRHFQQTGEILPELYRFFDQHGRWLGDRRAWRRDTYISALTRMRHAQLPASRRTTKTLAGTHLQTSFIWRSMRPLTLLYSEVAGSLLAPGRHTKISALNLRAIGNHFHTRTTAPINLPYLREIRGDCDVLATSNLRIPRLKDVGGNLQAFGCPLPSLTSVGGRLWMNWTPDPVLPKLRHVGGSIYAHMASTFVAPNLQTVGGDLVMSDLTREIRAPLLEKVGGDFLAEGTLLIAAGNLRTVGGAMVTSSARSYYNPDLQVGRMWLMHRDAILGWATREALKDDGIVI